MYKTKVFRALRHIPIHTSGSTEKRRRIANQRGERTFGSSVGWGRGASSNLTAAT